MSSPVLLETARASAVNIQHAASVLGLRASMDHTMVLDLVICLAVVALLLICWYVWFSHMNHLKLVEIVCWIEGMLGGHGHVADLQWFSPSQFRVRIRCGNGVFRRVWMRVSLIQRELPFRWLRQHLSKSEDQVTFEADLDAPPVSHLEVRTYRLYATTKRELDADDDHWQYLRTEPVILTTRVDWPRQIKSLIARIPSDGEHQFSEIEFSKQSPHFRATVPLDALSPENSSRSDVFSSLTHLASGISAARSRR